MEIVACSFKNAVSIFNFILSTLVNAERPTKMESNKIVTCCIVACKSKTQTNKPKWHTSVTKINQIMQLELANMLRYEDISTVLINYVSCIYWTRSLKKFPPYLSYFFLILVAQMNSHINPAVICLFEISEIIHLEKLSTVNSANLSICKATLLSFSWLNLNHWPPLIHT